MNIERPRRKIVWRRTRNRVDRGGVILLLVLVIVAALAVAVYTFSRHMLVDLGIDQSRMKEAQQQRLVDSAVEQLLTCDRTALQRLCIPTSDGRQAAPSLTGVATDGSGISGVATIKLPGATSESGIMAICANDPRGKEIQFGLSNESAKLNLNSLASRRISRKQAITKLMKYEDLSESTAEGIANALGIFDSKADTNTTGSPLPLNKQSHAGAVLTTLTQLLRVPGVTEERLLGEDRNANGVLDWNEDDGNATWPPDNADGKLDAGWSGHWTLIGAESGYRQGGKRKVDLNQSDLVSLYDEICQFASPEHARFVVAWRISSPVYTDASSADEAVKREEAANELATSFDDRLARQLGTASPPTSSSNSAGAKSSMTNPANVTKIRDGLDLSVRPSRRFRSLLDLASCQLQLIVEGKDTILVSPFPSDPVGLANWLPLWESQASVSSGDADASRINILQASHATLTTVDGISDELARAIVREREVFRSSETANSVAVLLESGLVTSSELRRMADEITVGGAVYRGYAVGHLQSSRTFNSKFIELDGRGSVITVRRTIDLPVSSARELSLQGQPLGSPFSGR